MIAMIETSSARVFNDCDDRQRRVHECSMIEMIVFLECTSTVTRVHSHIECKNTCQNAILHQIGHRNRQEETSAEMVGPS